MQNKVILIGRVGTKELNACKDQTSVMNFSLATTKSIKDKATGKWDDKTEWHKLVAFNNCADYINLRLHPGDLLYIEGELETKKWQDQNGINHYTTTIVVHDFPKKLPRYFTKNDSEAETQQSVLQNQYQQQPMASNNYDPDEIRC